MSIPNFVVTFRHELVSSVLISILLAAAAWPFRKLKFEWLKATAHLDAITTELTEQRTNCLATLQRQGDAQVNLLGKAVATLDGVRLDFAEQRGMLTATSARKRKARRKTRK
jgi:hypothetical protein